jgi:hypothetical protein
MTLERIRKQIALMRFSPRHREYHARRYRIHDEWDRAGAARWNGDAPIKR